MRRFILLLIISLANTSYASDNNNDANSNAVITSFFAAKRIMHHYVYADYRKTLYCNADFDDNKQIFLEGFWSNTHTERANYVEWEHVVPAENFGRAFVEWREGHEKCVRYDDTKFRGRECAQKTNIEFQYMHADMHNLYPAIGAVNAARINYNFTDSNDATPSFEGCSISINDRKVVPPDYAKGQIARAYLYMGAVYRLYNMSSQQKQLMGAWNKMYPVTDWECEREDRIYHIQGNHNMFIAEQCVK